MTTLSFVGFYMSTPSHLSTEPNNKLVNQNQPSNRLLSIDALRGFDMFWILGAEGLFSALFAITGWPFLHLLAEQMEHSTWHGFTAYDLIFPLFIFLSGISLGLSAKPMSSYAPEVQRHKLVHAFKRLFLLLFFGVLYNHGWGTGIPANLDDVRFASVLGRIGIAWFFAALIVWYSSIKIQYSLIVVILVGYNLALSFLSIGEFGHGQLSVTHALNAWFDLHLLPGAHYRNLAIDPEGLLSNIPSIVNALIGVMLGRHIKKWHNEPNKIIKLLAFSALAFLLLGYAWSTVFPLNKTLWTSSFVLVTCGYSLLLLLLFYVLVDVLKMTRWAHFFSIIGMNSIVIYLMSSLFDWSYVAKSLFGGLIKALPNSVQVLGIISAMLLCQWLFCWWLYKRNIFIKV